MVELATDPIEEPQEREYLPVDTIARHYGRTSLYRDFQDSKVVVYRRLSKVNDSEWLIDVGRRVYVVEEWVLDAGKEDADALKLGNHG